MEKPMCSLMTQSEKVMYLQEHLDGVPPPPSITNPKISIHDAAERLRYFLDNDRTTYPPVKDPTMEIVPLSTLFHGFHLNNTPYCEALDILYQKLQKRYVMEEYSSFTGTPATPVMVPQSPLPCDFIDFLPRSISSPASPAPDLLSIEMAQRRQQRRLSTSVTHNTRENPLNRSPRRKANLPIRKPRLSRSQGLVDQVIAMRTMNRSVPMVNLQSLQGSKVERRLIAVTKKTCTVVQTSPSVKRNSEKPAAVEELSEIHKTKLKYAVVQAIEKVTQRKISGDLFKQEKIALFRLLYNQWLKQSKEKMSTSADSETKGTSSRMLELALKYVPQVLSTPSE